MNDSLQDFFGQPLSTPPYKLRGPEFGVLAHSEKVELHSTLVSGSSLYEGQQLDLAFFACRKNCLPKMESLDGDTLANFNFELMNHFAIEKPRLVLLKPESEYSPQTLESARQVARLLLVYERLFRKLNLILLGELRGHSLQELEDERSLVCLSLDSEVGRLRGLCKHNANGQSFATLKISRVRWEWHQEQRPPVFTMSTARPNIAGRDDSEELAGAGYED